ncbi:MAG: hypothetical protein H0V82_01645 [Candidatus Protochlamydia sp.]|nr:hypothetical protein [Candidatus Protochlamydia sp.]
MLPIFLDNKSSWNEIINFDEVQESIDTSDATMSPESLEDFDIRMNIIKNRMLSIYTLTTTMTVTEYTNEQKLIDKILDLPENDQILEDAKKKIELTKLIQKKINQDFIEIHNQQLDLENDFNKISEEIEGQQDDFNELKDFLKKCDNIHKLVIELKELIGLNEVKKSIIID